MKLNEFDIIIIVGIAIIYSTSLWYIDISFSAMATGSQLINLYGIQNPYDWYHSALWVNQITFISMTLFFLLRNHISRFMEGKNE